ncbi:unnamed protein product [Tetraodon nigroviridis]|uniref:Cilia- and flagella-associated protein 91 n=1 Tax=Tetraodon nigroviridis TaxID=99883 RepID=Q4S0H2_TETNG|nr:unnamed protein product [Tetraodon nigroviridis]
MIQRARAKRAWKATLPPLDDLSQVDKRRQMMEEMEVQEWAFREAEIQKLHEARHAVAVDLLRERVEAQKKATNKTLNDLYNKLQNETETRKHKIHSDYMRSLRKLEAKWQNVKGKIAQQEVKQMVGGETWTDSDLSTGKTAYNNYIKSHYLREYDGLQTPVSSKLKKYKDLKREIEQVEEKPLRFLVKKEKPVPRPATPTVDGPPEEEEEKEHAVLVIQKILRGRRVQYEMIQGVENHMELIQEIRTVNALQKEEQELQEADKELVLSLKEQRDQARHETLEEEASQAGLMGAELYQLFDTMSKDLVRLQEERRLHALVLLAERERRMREAEESGRRQVEERRRREEDEIFRQVVQVHQETVDLYLEDIILETLEHTVDQQAREDIHRRAQEVNNIAFTMEDSRNRLQSEEIVSELVYSFLIPEIEKMSIRERVHQRQQRHLQAAQIIIRETLEHVGNDSGALRSSQSSCRSEGASSLDRESSRVDEEPDDFISTGRLSDGQPTRVTTMVQTDYRESEAQTDPYSPDYVVQPGTTPSELLQLANLTWALRKLEAKWQNVKGKIAQQEVKQMVGGETWTDSDLSTGKTAYNNYIKSHYLREYDDTPASTELKKYRDLKREIEQVEEKPLRFLVKKEKPVPRPATPTVDGPPEEEEEKEHAILVIQKILRGRRVQYEMIQGVENHMELIQEIRTVTALQKEEQELQEADKELVLSLKEQRDQARHETLEEEASQAGLRGAELYQLFDTMSKELVRLQEERRLHALVLLAERERRMREAEESGRRQVEERRRREEDEIFRQVVQVHQETVDLYLEDIILETLEHTVDQQAREDIHRRAQEVNNITFTMEDRWNRLQSEEIVSELVYSFLIPEIEKMSIRERERQRQQRYLQAAQIIVQETFENLGNDPGSPRSSQSSCPSEGASSRVDEEP